MSAWSLISWSFSPKVSNTLFVVVCFRTKPSTVIPQGSCRVTVGPSINHQDHLSLFIMHTAWSRQAWEESSFNRQAYNTITQDVGKNSDTTVLATVVHEKLKVFCKNLLQVPTHLVKLTPLVCFCPLRVKMELKCQKTAKSPSLHLFI